MHALTNAWAASSALLYFPEPKSLQVCIKASRISIDILPSFENSDCVFTTSVIPFSFKASRVLRNSEWS